MRTLSSISLTGFAAMFVLAATGAHAADAAPPEPVQVSVEIGAGYERYQNAIVFLDDFGEVRAGTGTRTRSSPFRAVAASLDFDLPLVIGGSWTLGFDVEAKRTPELPELHRNRWRAATGFVVPTEGGEVEIRLTADELSVFNSGFKRNARGAQIRVVDQADRGRTVGSLQVQRFRHDAFDDLFDADQAVASVLHRRVFNGAWQPALAGRLAWGAERNRWRFDDLSSRDALFEIEAGVAPAAAWRVSAAGSRRSTRYGGPAPGLDFTRKDQWRTGKLTLQHTADPARITRLELETVERESNDPVAAAAVRRAGLSIEWIF